MAAQACRTEAERVHSVMLRSSKTMTTVAAQSHRNGVDVAKLFATLDAVKAHPEAASFRFGVTNRWISGTHNRNEISSFYGVGAEQQHESTFAIEADHPAVLVGGDAAPTPARGNRTMHAVESLVVGAVQAGLAVSRSLTGPGADHVVVERGRIAERW